MAKFELNETDLTAFLHHFSTTLFFLKPLPFQKFAPKKVPKLKNSSNKPIYLGSPHVNVLWIISQLAQSPDDHSSDGHRPAVNLKRIQKIFLWYSRVDHSAVTDLGRMLRALKDAGFLESDGGTTNKYYWFSDEGLKFLEDSRRLRKRSLGEFLKMCDLDKTSANNLLKLFDRTSAQIWEKIVSQANEIDIPDPRKNGRS